MTRTSSSYRREMSSYCCALLFLSALSFVDIINAESRHFVKDNLIQIERGQTIENDAPKSYKLKASSAQSKTSTRSEKAVSKPHIVFIIADDLGYSDVGYHGKRMGSIADTPAIDALAYSGVRLENYYVQPSCTPTRASLLTGRYPIRLGLQNGNIDPPDPNCLPLDEITLADKLRDLGYATHAIGKWHLGFSRSACLPTRRGFDSYFGIVLGMASHFSRNHRYAKTLYNNETLEWKYDGVHSSELYTQRAVNIIKNHNNHQPLFLFLSHQAVHNPLQVSKTYERVYKLKYPQTWKKLGRDKPGSIRKKYLAMTKSLDVSVDVVTETLKETGLWNNTVFIFTSDNGGKQCSGGGNNWPLRGEKGTLWEGGIKAVGIVNSPLLSTEVIGTVQTGMMHVSDWFPTLVEGVAGGVAEGRFPMDGLNMWPTIFQGLPSPRYEMLHNIKYESYKSHTENSLKKNKDTATWGRFDQLPFNPRTSAAIRFGKWKLVTGFHASCPGSWEPPTESRKPVVPMSAHDEEGIYIRLYNIQEDPMEYVNIASVQRHVVKHLLNTLRFYKESSIKPRRDKDPFALPIIHVSGEKLAWKPWLP